MEHSAPTGWVFIKFYIMNLLKYVTKTQGGLKWDKKNQALDVKTYVNFILLTVTHVAQK
jgi:hypothetical protein